MKLSRREQILLTILIAAVILYAYYHFLYLPVHEQRLYLMAENTRLKKLLQQDAEQMAKESYDTDALIQEMTSLAAQLPDAPFLPEMLSSLHKIAQDKGVQLLSFHFNNNALVEPENPTEILLQNELKSGSIINSKSTNNKNSSSLQEIKFSIETQGSYPDLASYILALENNPRIIIFHNVKLAAQNKKAEDIPLDEQGNTIELPPSKLVDANNIKCSIDISAYYDTNSWTGITGIPELGSGSGKGNPFAK